MKRIMTAVAALALVSLAGAGALNAQTRASFFVSGGLTNPLGTFNDIAKLGWNGQAGVQFAMPSWPVAIRVDGMYGQNTTDSAVLPAGVTGKTKIFAGTGNLVYQFKTASNIKPYILGGGGVANVKGEATSGGTTSSASETKALINGGLGIKSAMSAVDIGVEGRIFDVFTSGNSTTFITVNLVVGFGGKGGM